MRPIALAFKDYEVNPFTGRGGGELMLIHQCTNCGKLSPNRIAGDDNEYQILCLIKESVDLSQILASKLEKLGLTVITSENKGEALISLFGTTQLPAHLRG
jgi:hypothetical protein